MRGKKEIWMTMAIMLFASLALSMVNISKASPGNAITVNPPAVPGSPGDSFSVTIELDYAEGVRAFGFILNWNPTILKLDAANPVVEGPFLQQAGVPTFFTYSIGFGGESITLSDIILKEDTWVDGGGVLVTLNFNVIGGGTTPLHFEIVRLQDPQFNDLPDVTWTDGLFYSTAPFVAFTWYVQTGFPREGDVVDVNGTRPVVSYDPDGDSDYTSGPPYTTQRPFLRASDIPNNCPYVEGGAMIYGDRINFSATGSYDPDGTIVSYHWKIREGGVNNFTWKGGPATPYKTKWETGDSDPAYALGATENITWQPPFRSSLYGKLLGWVDLNLTVTDNNGNKSTYYTWIRVFRINPAKTVMVNISKSHVKVGDTVVFGGKIQNQGGTNLWPWEVLLTYISLGRQIHEFMWARLRFDILDSGKHIVATAWSDAVWICSTENEVNPLYGTWTVPTGFNGGYTVRATGYFCGSGVTFGQKASGIVEKPFEVA